LAVGGELATASTEVYAAEPEPRRETDFASRWTDLPDRIWIGEQFWSNPLQDWRIAGGRLECVNAALDRNVHLLTRQLAERAGGFETRVRIGRAGGGKLSEGKGSAGFRIGIRGPLDDYRNALLSSNGFDAGLSPTGLLLGRGVFNSEGLLDRDSIELRLTATPEGAGYRIKLSAHDPESGRGLSSIEEQDLPAARLVGNLALVANFPGPTAGPRPARTAARTADRYWFADWRVTGDKLVAHDDQAFGPILFAQYTLSGGVLKMTAQMPPLGEKDEPVVRLQIEKDGEWRPVGEAKIEPRARTATFRSGDWDENRETSYRLVYTQQFTDGTSHNHEFTGVIRRDPVNQPVLTVADVSCNIHAAFPNPLLTANMAKLNPDLIAFTGDQFYESSGGYGTQRSPLEPSIVDYLRKWYLHGWTWRELMRDRPSISIPDDHDVYQGNVWGEGGAARETTQEAGGYELPAEWVSVVHRTQTSHHADAYDPTPVKQGLIPYYGPLTYGGVSFAILADRMFKTGPEGEVPPTGGRGDHVKDPDFDPKTADLPGLELLGEGQMKFLREWAADWRGAEMKAVVSQTIFTAMATTHGQGRERLRADYDTNGWPQSQRNAALREIRKAFAVHLAGDQHLPAVIHYGIDDQADAGVAFAGPAVNVGYPRWFEPEKPGENRKPGAPEETGDFLDHFDNPMRVLAVANSPLEQRTGLLERLHDKTSGIGLVRFDKANRKITIECWPYLADVSDVKAQFPGWPVTIDVAENYGRKPAAHLPMLKIKGRKDAVVQVINEQTKDVEYTLRITGDSFRAPVFDADATYTLRVGEQPGPAKSLAGVRPGDGMLEVAF
jgi:hypothetical protein